MIKKRIEIQSQIAQKYKLFNKSNVRLYDLTLSSYKKADNSKDLQNNPSQFLTHIEKEEHDQLQKKKQMMRSSYNGASITQDSGKIGKRLNRSQEKYIYHNRISHCETVNSKSFNKSSQNTSVQIFNEAENDSKKEQSLRKYKFIAMNNEIKNKLIQQKVENQRQNIQSTIDNIVKIHSKETVDNINTLIEQETKTTNVFKQIEIIKNNISAKQSRSTTPHIIQRNLQTAINFSRPKEDQQKFPINLTQSTHFLKASQPTIKCTRRRLGFNMHNKYDVMVHDHFTKLQKQLYQIKKINQNDNKSIKQIKQLLVNKDKIAEIIFNKDLNQVTNFKIDFEKVRSVLIQENKKINFGNSGDQILVKVDKEATQQVKELCQQIEELYNQRVRKNLKWMESQITNKQFNYYDHLRQFETNLCIIVEKVSQSQTQSEIQLINKQMLNQWEKYKNLIGNNSYIMYDKIIWDQIQQFEFKFGPMKTLKKQTLSIAKYLSSIIGTINGKLHDYKQNQE